MPFLLKGKPHALGDAAVLVRVAEENTHLSSTIQAGRTFVYGRRTSSSASRRVGFLSPPDVMSRRVKYRDSRAYDRHAPKFFAHMSILP
jgi:hypothetical protein